MLETSYSRKDLNDAPADGQLYKCVPKSDRRTPSRRVSLKFEFLLLFYYVFKRSKNVIIFGNNLKRCDCKCNSRKRQVFINVDFFIFFFFSSNLVDLDAHPEEWEMREFTNRDSLLSESYRNDVLTFFERLHKSVWELCMILCSSCLGIYSRKQLPRRRRVFGANGDLLVYNLIVLLYTKTPLTFF